MTHPTKRCYLVRHAQTLWNEQNRIQGHSDQPLSPLGLEQAKRVGAFFSGRPIAGLFTSWLQRSRQTAQAIVDHYGRPLTLIEERDLAEMHLGAWEGLTPEEVDAQYQGAYRQWRLQPSTVRIPDAEPVPTFQRRAWQALERVASQVNGGDYVVVSHGGVIAAILAQMWGADYDAVLRKLRLDNGGITALEFGAPVPHVLWVNATAHLEPLPTGAMWF